MVAMRAYSLTGLPLAQQRQDRCGQVQAATSSATALALQSLTQLDKPVMSG